MKPKSEDYIGEIKVGNVPYLNELGLWRHHHIERWNGKSYLVRGS